MKLDPTEDHNKLHTEHEVRSKLLDRLKYHCRRRVTYLPQVERKEAKPKAHKQVFAPWLPDWIDLEWQATEDDIKRFQQVYFVF